MMSRARDSNLFFLNGAGLLLALAAMLPLAGLLFLAFATEPGPLWQQSRFFLLSLYLRESVALALGAGALALLFGTAAGWAVAACRFPARDLLAWLLVLPLALPPYVLAYVYGEFFDRFLWLPPIRSLPGAALILALALYPYVYLAARLAFTREALASFQAARVLGRPGWRCFFSVSLPAARPALVAGLALVLMESFNDIGVAEYCGIRSLTAGIYDLWLNRGELAAALRVAVMLLFCIFALLVLERALRRRRRYHASLTRPAHRQRPGARLQAAALALCLLLPVSGFFLPALLLVFLWLEAPPQTGLLPLAAGSLSLALPAALLTVFAALLLAYFVRLNRENRVARFIARLAGMGYAVPGAVLALGVLAPLAFWDHFRPDGIELPYLFSGAAPLLFAYFVRFLILPYGLAEAALARIRPSLDHAAQLLGARAAARLFLIHLPLLRPALGAGLLLVFVEVMRELPATLLLRPFNFETLATRLYDYASLGLFEQSAGPALLLLLLGLAPALIWHHLRR